MVGKARWTAPQRHVAVPSCAGAVGGTPGVHGDVEEDRPVSPKYGAVIVVVVVIGSAVAAGSSLLRYVLRPGVAVVVLARVRRVEDIGGGYDRRVGSWVALAE